MIQQRKTPAKRLYRPGIGGVGVIDAALDQQNQQAAAPRGRGRPPKYGRTMSPAEQKRRKREEKDRRDLTAWLLRKFRSMQPSATKVQTTGNFNGTTIRDLQKQREKFADTLSTVPVDELKRLKSVWSETPDGRGRLHGERSGEADHKHGQSEVEAIAEQQRLFDEGGRRGKPQGHGPALDEDSDADTDEQSSKTALKEFRSNEEESQRARRFYDKLHLVARWMMKDGKCSVCGSTEGEEHIWLKYYECTAAEARFRALHQVDPGSARYLHGLIDHDHLHEIDKLLRKRWAFFSLIDNRAAEHSGGMVLKVEDLLKRGWSFFSTVADRTEHLLPPRELSDI